MSKEPFIAINNAKLTKEVRVKPTVTYHVPKEEQRDFSPEFRKTFKTSFPKVEDKVLQILKNDKYARKDYLWLLIRFYDLEGMIKLVVPYQNFTKANSPETISRARRKLYQKAKEGHEHLKFLLAEKDYIKFSKEREKEVKEYFKNETK